MLSPQAQGQMLKTSQAYLHGKQYIFLNDTTANLQVISLSTLLKPCYLHNHKALKQKRKCKNLNDNEEMLLLEKIIQQYMEDT